MTKIDLRLAYLQSKKQNSKNWNISWNLGVFLSNLVQMKNPKTVLEVGTSNGFSTLWIAKGCRYNSKIYTIDVNEERLNLAKENFNYCNLSNVVPILGEVKDILFQFEFKEKFDFVFLDALQREYIDLILLLEEKNLLNDDCLIVCDNVLSHSYMKDFIDFMHLKFDCEIVEIDSGFLVAKKKKD